MCKSDTVIACVSDVKAFESRAIGAYFGPAPVRLIQAALCFGSIKDTWILISRDTKPVPHIVTESYVFAFFFSFHYLYFVVVRVSHVENFVRCTVMHSKRMLQLGMVT